MQIHAMVFNWPGQTPKAERLEAILRPLVARCDVINSDMAACRSGWRNIGNAYFTEQWQAARELLDGDVLMMICADVWSDELPAIVKRAAGVMQRLPLGIYAPNVEWTSWVFDRRQLEPHVELDLYQVPQTDGLLLFVRSDIVRALPPLDANVNKLGWGIDATLIAIAVQRGYWVCRDYRFRVRHPRGSNYDTRAAQRQMNAWIAGFPRELKSAVERVVRNANAMKVLPNEVRT